MAGKFELRKFSEINLNDSFFDELKRDYPGTSSSTGFIEWFKKKSLEGKTALVFSDEIGLGAFICIKNEEETIELKEKELPAISRIKISTLRIAERYRGQRLGEGALGLILWKWQQSMCEEIYVTVFSNHSDLISQIEKFGFTCKDTISMMNVFMHEAEKQLTIPTLIRCFRLSILIFKSPDTYW